MHAVVVEAGAPTPAAAEVLVERALAWAGELAGAPAVRSTADPAAIVAGAGPDRMPLLLVASHMPRLGDAHAQSVRDDLAAGADLVLGATLGGSWYLLALAAPQPDLLDGWAAPHRAVELLAAAGAAGLEVGLLRHERVLESEADVRALLADPLLPREVREALAG